MLHAMRKRMQEMAEAEDQGHSFWTEAFSVTVRRRVLHAYDRLMESHGYAGDKRLFTRARHMIVEQLGLAFVHHEGFNPVGDFHGLLHEGVDELYPSGIEALLLSVQELDDIYERGAYGRLANDINEILAQERVAWNLVDGEMIAMKSSELHDSVVEPALRLLHDARYSDVDRSYREALDELSKGNGDDAVTDAGRSLQELLIALGCDGKSLGPLITSARKMRLLGAHDTPLLQAVVKAMEWVSADRSQVGDGHRVSDATREDAWLIVHIVGAFIVRLASGEQRPNRD